MHNILKKSANFIIKNRLEVIFFLLFIGIFAIPTAHAERLKDIASIQGVRSNQLIGYGLVVGLDGTGDQTTQTPFTVQSIISMMQQMGVNLPPGTSLQLKNVASVMITSSLPAFRTTGTNFRHYCFIHGKR